MTKILVWCVACVVALGATELLLRLVVQPDDLYSRIRAIPERHAWHNAVRFWDKQRKLIGSAGTVSIGGFDPQLGWDADVSGDRIRGAANVPLTPNPTTGRVLILGDSYAFGTELAAEENFSAVLNARANGLEALNMGVPGYGIDQAVLKYELFGRQYSAKVVLFAIYVTDYERSSVDFTFFAKPKAVSLGAHWSLVNSPVRSPIEQFETVDQALNGRFFVLEVLRNLTYRSLAWVDGMDAFFNHTDAVVGYWLQRLQNNLSSDQQLVILHIRRAESFLETDSYRDRVSERLLKLYAQHNLKVLNLSTLLLAQASPETVAEQFYLRRASGSLGHLNAAGHGVIADAIEKTLDASAEQGYGGPRQGESVRTDESR